MTDQTPSLDRSAVRLLLISNSTMHGGGYLEHCAAEIADFLGPAKRVLFVPYALDDHDAYAAKARPSLDAMGHELRSAHTYDDPDQALDDADAVFIGGGNTFRLLAQLERTGLLEAIRQRALAGMPYMGSSAGTNVANCGRGFARHKFESAHVALRFIESGHTLSSSMVSSGASAPAASTLSRVAVVSPAMLPSAHTACSRTSSFGESKSCTKMGTAPLAMTTRVCSEVPEAMLVRAHALSNWSIGLSPHCEAGRQGCT